MMEKSTGGEGLLAIFGGKMDDGCDWCMIVTATKKDVAILRAQNRKASI